MIPLKKIDYEKQLEKKIEELSSIIEKQSKALDEITCIFEVQDMQFCFTGRFKKGRAYWKKRINKLGGRVSNPNYYCTYCVTNDVDCESKITHKCRHYYKHVMITEKQLSTLLDNV
jgi:NAD-dependent DNA ligase